MRAEEAVADRDHIGVLDNPAQTLADVEEHTSDGANHFLADVPDFEECRRSTDYDKLIDSKFADMKQTGGRHGGSITAALFLQRFTNGVPWAHLDIAPTAWANKSPSPTVPEGGVGFAVRTLDRMVADTYEA